MAMIGLSSEGYSSILENLGKAIDGKISNEEFNENMEGILNNKITIEKLEKQFGSKFNHYSDKETPNCQLLRLSEPHKIKHSHTDDDGNETEVINYNLDILVELDGDFYIGDFESNQIYQLLECNEDLISFIGLNGDLMLIELKDEE
jgi:hypothetical protein